MKLGKLPAKDDLRTLKLSAYLDRAALTAPPSANWYQTVSSWPMYGNDKVGDCVLPDTLAVAPGLSKAYRIPYNGPVVTVITRTGKRLTSTRNHAVLTTRGFVRACLLKEGDYVLCSDFPQAVAHGMDDYFHDVPSRIEDIFQAHQRVALPRGEKWEMARAVDFHGDARFFEGEVHVVDANGFLQRRDVPPFSEPEGEDSFVFCGRPSIALDGYRPLYSHLRPISLATTSGLCLQSVLSSFLGSHAFRANQARFGLGTDADARGGEGGPKTAVPYARFCTEVSHGLAGKVASRQLGDDSGNAIDVVHASGFGSRPWLNASSDYPTLDGHATDPELPSELVQRFPSLVAPDEIVYIENHWWSGHVYDLSTDARWYIANGIVSHNCTIAGAAHLIQCWTANAGAIVTPAEADVLSAYNYFSHGDPNAGAVCLDVLNYWRTTGIGGHRIFAFTGVSQNTQEELRESVALFGGCYLGLALPNYVLDGDPLQIPWEISPDTSLEDKAPNPNNGHCVVAVGYDAANVYVVTWGQVKSLSWEFFSTYCDEAYAILTQDWIGKNSESPSGFNFATLQTDLAAIL